MTHRTRTMTITAAAIASLLLAGCGGDSEDAAEPMDPSPEITHIPDDNAGGPIVLDLGAANEFDDGLTVTAAVAEVFAPNDYANFGDDQPYALVEVTATNGTGAPFALDMVLSECVVDGQAAEREAFDGITTSWPSVVQDGRDATWSEACLLGEGTELEYGLSLGDRDQLWFTGTVDQ
ncbi:hypothetical protein ACWD33_26160 [Streptomyces xiamenensis]